MRDLPRHTLWGKVLRGTRKPERILPYLARYYRNWRIRRTSSGFVDYYRRIVDVVAAEDPDRAVGSPDHGNWQEIGGFQFSYLRHHGLESHYRLLEIGCGNLRAGRYFIEFLDSGNYVGIDISQHLLIAALDVVKTYGLASKKPYLYLVRDADYRFLPPSYFDVIHAHSVFTHLPLDVIEEILVSVKPIVKPDGFFDFTFLPSKTQGTFLDEDFYYPEDLMLEVTSNCGYWAQLMTDWDYPQRKIRARLAREPLGGSGRIGPIIGDNLAAYGTRAEGA